MGNCLATEARVPTAFTISLDDDHHDHSSDGVSQSTGYTTASGGTITNSSYGSFYTANNQFSEGDGYAEAYPTRELFPSGILKKFSFAELKVATRNFRSDTVLGEGAFGKVFKGWIVDKGPMKIGTIGNAVAVKRLNSESLQGFKQWQSEVNFLGGLSHPNVVRLLGYCWEDKKLLLVYEFMRKGSLDYHLFRNRSGVSAFQPLPWDIRLKIAIGAARGLAFLHTSEKQLIYRDFKTSNILLDESYTAKISDFGLARFGPSSCESHVTTRVVGTYGYAAPEYIATGNLYVKSDVYGFGVVLVEILTGLRAIDTKRPSGSKNLVDWIKPRLSERRKLKSIMDSRLEGRYPSKAAFEVASLALNCLEAEPMNRPSMKEVVERLERFKAISEDKGPKFKIPFFTSSSSKTEIKLINSLP